MQYLTADELGKLFPVIRAANKTHHLIALVAFWTGARISQVLALKGEDIFEANGRLVIKIGAAKRGYERVKTLHIDENPDFDLSPLIELAKQRPAALLFGGTWPSYFNKCLKEKYCPAAGIHSDFGHSHVFRHSIAIQIWEKTHSLGSITHFLQHRSPTTAFYYLAENDGRKAQEAVDGLQLAEA
jgi:integrase